MSFDEEPDNPEVQYAANYRNLAKAWRNFAEDLFARCCEGGTRGRPMDLFHRDDWQRQRNWLKEIAELATKFDIPELFPDIDGYERVAKEGARD